MKLEYKQANIEHLETIYNIVQETIKTVYPKYYPAEIVHFFCELHNRKAIQSDIENGLVDILTADGTIVGTGSHSGNHITRVYVLPNRQGQGFGSCIMQNIEDQIAANYDTACLDASLPASILYEHRGYTTVKHEKWDCKNGAVLIYEIMEKKLRV